VTWLDAVDELGRENPWSMPRRPSVPWIDAVRKLNGPPHLSASARQTDQRPGDDRRPVTDRSAGTGVRPRHGADPKVAEADPM